MSETYDFGMVGLGTMGSSLLLNMADHGAAVSGLDTCAEKAEALTRAGAGKRVAGTTDARTFVASLRTPRAIMMLVPAGAPVDSVIAQLSPLLVRGDILIDGGNSYYKDTERRGKDLGARGIEFLGLGVSGGESGARHGPSMMAGGTPNAYLRVKDTLESVAAKFEGEPCVALLGPGGSGHYVKMVHNGIEYGLMQLIAEAYDLMHRGLGMSVSECADTFARWNEGDLRSFLVEITSIVLHRREGDAHLVDLISDKAKQKGTGKWASQDALDLGMPLLTIDAAVGAREISGLKDQRVRAAGVLTGTASGSKTKDTIVAALEDALVAAWLLSYAQGFAQLGAASAEYNYSLDLPTVARIWRSGCIIRSSLLELMADHLGEENLLLDPVIASLVNGAEPALRRVTVTGIEAGIPMPCFTASVAYLDSYRSAKLPANLIQAQRDFFGAHGYERVDKQGSFHTPDWEVR